MIDAINDFVFVPLKSLADGNKVDDFAIVFAIGLIGFSFGVISYFLRRVYD